MYFLIDLERTILSGRVHYWKAMKRGYTTNIAESGVYMEDAAKEIVEKDVDRQTIMIDETIVENIQRL